MSESFLPITLISLKDCFKDVPIDIYLKLAEGKFVKAFERTTGLDFARLANYESKGMEYFYIKECDKRDLDLFLSRSPMMTLTSNAPVEVKRKAIWAIMEQTLFESFGLSQLNDLNVTKVYEALKSSLERDGEFVKIVTMLIQVAPKTDLFFRHAITTAIYSYMIALLAGHVSQRSLKIVLFAAFFHDMGKTKIPENRRVANQNRTIHEIEEFRMHPLLTVQMFPTPLPFADEEIRRCILQHKERMDGKGYPYQIRGAGLYALSKVLTIADAFSELTLGLEDGNCYTHAQAIATMKSDMGRFETKLLLPFAQMILNRGLSNAA